MAPVVSQPSRALVDRSQLDKIDKLRRLGIGVALPQVVVVGAQSAGKSSTLESITGFSLPRGATLCTRFATEIICRREDVDQKTYSISIQPALGSSAQHQQEALAFHRTVSSLEGNEFMKIFEEASAVMGIKTDNQGSGPAFSRDVLRVEITGPDEEHLTVIDVPGIFENTTPGVTTETDIALVDQMVKEYISETRTIILAVVPCNGDIANQKIITWAEKVDPEGKRTLGILTKPDQVLEQATRQPVLNLVQGKRKDLALGYHVIRNRGADDETSTREQREFAEEVFFGNAPWNTLEPARIGVPALRRKISILLEGRMKDDMPFIRKDITSRLKTAQGKLADMGAPRSTEQEQRTYLCVIAQKFRKLMEAGLNGHYTATDFSDEGLVERYDLRLATRIREMNMAFSAKFYSRGHTQQFLDEEAAVKSEEDGLFNEEDGQSDEEEELYSLSFEVPVDVNCELGDILVDPTEWPAPLSGDIIGYISDVHKKSASWEMGTFSIYTLSYIFKDQTSKWEPVTLSHVSNAILTVHNFVHQIICVSCVDDTVRAELWARLIEDLTTRYRRAMDHARFLLSVERVDYLSTVNPDFYRAFSDSDRAHAMEAAKKHMADMSVDEVVAGKTVKALMMLMLTQIMASGEKENGEEAMSRKIHDVLKNYYVISRSRFVDVVCKQAVEHFLLGADGPLRVLDERWVIDLPADLLDTITGEPLMDRTKRDELKKEIEGLVEAKKVVLK